MFELDGKMQKRVVVLTGAGVSAESGLKTFRDNNGLWENYAVTEVATPEAFATNPDLVYRFYNERRRQLLNEAKPNPAHYALADLEACVGDNFLLITQNVDNLHEQAGSKHLLHMHGELLRASCTVTGKAFALTGDIDGQSRCQCCHPGQPIRPDIVWFGEAPYHMERIMAALHAADVFISIGTSGHVYPAAGFVREARSSGAHTIELNLEPSQQGSAFAETHYGPAARLVPSFVRQFMQEPQRL